MNEGKYNIPRQFKVDKGMPLEVLFDKIGNSKCRRIFEEEIESITWSYHIVDSMERMDMMTLLRQKGISVFEVQMRRKISPELMTEVFAGLLQRPIVMVYICEDELSMGTFIPVGEGKTGKYCTTEFYKFDTERMIEILDFEEDAGKSTEQIHARILATLRLQKRIIMIEKAFERIDKDDRKREDELNLEFSLENLNKIRQDADFITEQLKVF